MSKKEVNKISNEDIVEKVSDEVDTFLNKRDWSKHFPLSVSYICLRLELSDSWKVV